MRPDPEQRLRACRETGLSFAVEASAGTGKTRTLIDRILHLVLGSGVGGKTVPLSGICAITFTERAAGEMKVRLRQEFESLAARGGPAGDRAREALKDLESAAISTFHAFAVSLLKERPVEAGLDPRFVALDDIQGRLFFRETWETWISRALLERRGPLEAALRAGMGLEQLRTIAATLREHSLLIRGLRLEPPPSEDEVSRQTRELLDAAQKWRKLAGNPDDKLAACLDKAIDWLAAPASAPAPKSPGKAGAQSNWEGGKAAVESVQGFVREVVEFQKAFEQLPGQRLLDAVICWLIDDFLAEWERRKRERGFLDFDDMLESARRLLASSRPARGEFQRRYAAVLVDEFQDTDSVQLEIVLLLTCTDLDETDPARLRPEPGRLFLVGDPKQSIYRFRGADIETYLDTVDPDRAARLALERLELTVNFRSVPSILRFVDEAFGGSMRKEGNYQPSYLAFCGKGDRSEEPAAPSVYVLGDWDDKGRFAGSGREFAKLEASRIANLAAWIRRNGKWMVEDRELRTHRAPEWRDIAILLPVLTRVELVEEKLSGAGIPYVLEGGRFYYMRSEVASALNVLRATANPNDAVALYAALRSIFFGLSDEDLLRAHLEGMPLDYRAGIPEGSPLFRPYRILRELHLHRHSRPASETLEGLLAQTGAREVLAVRGFQSVANLAKLARTLRAIQQGRTFSQVVEMLISMDDQEVDESESRLMEEKSDAVRIMSVHKAKGLDFPIVIVAGLGFNTRKQQGSFLADRHRRKTFVLKVGSKVEGVRTPGWDDLFEEEKRKEEAELSRLLYVSFTRARDHLVLCTHTRGKSSRDSGRVPPDFERTRLRPLADFLSSRLTPESGLARFIDPRDLPETRAPEPGIDAAEDCGAVLRREREILRRLVEETPRGAALQTAAGSHGEAASEERPAGVARNRAARRGTAFHEAMERASFENEALIPTRAAESGRRHLLDAESVRLICEMMSNCFNSPLLERVRNTLRSGRRVIREIPYVRPLPRPDAADSTQGVGLDGVEEGVIDLLFEEPDGWVLVDYKTDLVSADGTRVEAFGEKYGRQIRAYAQALATVNIRVKAAYLLLASTGDQIEIPL